MYATEKLYKFSKQTKILKTACLFFLCFQVFTSCFPMLTYKNLSMQSLYVTIAKSCLQEFPSGEKGFLLFEIPNIHFKKMISLLAPQPDTTH